MSEAGEIDCNDWSNNGLYDSTETLFEVIRKLNDYTVENL